MDRFNQHPPASNPAALIPHPVVSRTGQQQLISNPQNLTYGIEGVDADDSEGGLLEYWGLLVRNKKIILLASLTGLVLGFAIGIPLKPEYRAHASLEVLNLNQDFLNMRQASPTTTNSESSDASEEQTQAKLLQSDALLKRAFGKLHPQAQQISHKTGLATAGWRHWLHLPEPLPVDLRQELLIKAARSLKVVLTPHTRILDVTADSKDPQLATDFINTLVDEFIQDNLESRRNSTQRTGEWLRQEIDEARNRLQKSEDALQAYARKSGLIFTDETTNVQTEKLKQIQQQLSSATSDRINKESHYKLSKTSPPDSLADVLGDESLTDATGKLNDLRQKVASLSAVFNPGYSRLEAAQAELAVVQAAFNRERDDILGRIETDYKQALSNEKLLSAAYDTQIREVTGQSEKGIQYNILRREVDSNRQLYDTMLQQTKQASVASAMRASNVRVVDPAELPTVPFFPNFLVNSVLGLLCGFLFSVCGVLIRERSDRALQQPGDIKLWANLTELGTIPSISTKAISYYGRAAAEKLRPKSTNRPARAELMTLEHKPSAVAEAFRSVLTSILFTSEGDGSGVLVFTSANSGDGKTTTVSNLALATAEIRQKVIVIDADLRRPRMHDIFGLPNERGLSDLLTEEFSDENLASLIHQTSVPGLDVITGGAPTQAATHLLYSPNFISLIAKLRQDYGMILIDTPPMLQMADARVVARVADAVVIVTRAGQTTRDSLMAIKERFAEDRRRILGTVLNRWDPTRSPSGYYKTYSGSYTHYGYTPDKT